MSKVFEKENEELLGFYAGVGEELTLHFNIKTNEFYVIHSAAPCGCWELYRGKDGIQANEKFQAKFKEILSEVIEEYQRIKGIVKTAKICPIDSTKEMSPENCKGCNSAGFDGEQLVDCTA
ncbi:MAG: hypothetical protein M1490_03260 [Candidatus Bathyarchaeota archaeon]|nr:hypothetical protein [Candidatus Bathyarchaeota archaeon]